MKMFPVLHGKKLKAIPWALVEPHARQANANHFQTLERLAERGGMTAFEINLVLDDAKHPGVLFEMPKDRELKLKHDAEQERILRERLDKWTAENPNACDTL